MNLKPPSFNCAKVENLLRRILPNGITLLSISFGLVLVGCVSSESLEVRSPSRQLSLTDFNIYTPDDELKLQRINWQCESGWKSIGVYGIRVVFKRSGPGLRTGSVQGHIVPIIKDGDGKTITFEPTVDTQNFDEVAAANSKFVGRYRKYKSKTGPRSYRVVGEIVNVRRSPGKGRGNRLRTFNKNEILVGYTEPIFNKGLNWVLVGRDGQASGFVALEAGGKKLIKEYEGPWSYRAICDKAEHDQSEKLSKLFPRAKFKSDRERVQDGPIELLNFQPQKIHGYSTMADIVGEIKREFSRRRGSIAIYAGASSGNRQPQAKAPSVHQSIPTTQVLPTLKFRQRPFRQTTTLHPSECCSRVGYIDRDKLFQCQAVDKNRWCELKKPFSGYVNLGMEVRLTKDDVFYGSADKGKNTDQYNYNDPQNKEFFNPVVTVYPHPEKEGWGFFAYEGLKYYLEIKSRPILQRAFFGTSGGSIVSIPNVMQERKGGKTKFVAPDPTQVRIEDEKSKARNATARVLAQLSLRRPFTVGLLLPSEVRPKKLFNRITIEGCDRKKGQGGRIGEYHIFTCDRNVSYFVRISPFNTVPIVDIKMAGASLRRANLDVIATVSAKQLIGDFFATIPVASKSHYRYGGRKLRGSKDPNLNKYAILSFPNRSLVDLNKSLHLTFPGNKECDLSFKFSLENMKRGRPLQLIPKCDIIKIKSVYKLNFAKSIRGCAKISGSPTQMTCVRVSKAKISFRVGPAWERRASENQDLKSITLSKKHFQPLWPFKENDPWLDEKRASANACNEIPNYRAKEVRYCSVENGCKSGTVKIVDRKFQLPSLEAVDWKKNTNLPTSVSVQFYRKLPSKLYPAKKQIKWRLGKRPPADLKSAMNIPQPPKKMLRVKVDFDVFKADPSTRFMLFDSADECRRSAKPKGKNWRPYHPTELSGLQAHKCSFAKLRKSETDLTDCSLPKQVGKNWVFRLLETGFPGKRIVVLIANSKKFNNKIGIGIRNSIISWLESLKKRGVEAPISVLTVEGDGRIRTLIRAEELTKMKITSKKADEPTIRALIKQRLIFNGTGLQPLENLQDFEHKLQNNIDRVLYLTDASLRDEDDIRGADLGTPLNWKLSGVGFKVATTGRCSFWTEKARVQKCEVISRKNARKIVGTMLANLGTK